MLRTKNWWLFLDAKLMPTVVVPDSRASSSRTMSSALYSQARSSLINHTCGHEMFSPSAYTYFD